MSSCAVSAAISAISFSTFALRAALLLFVLMLPFSTPLRNSQIFTRNLSGQFGGISGQSWHAPDRERTSSFVNIAVSLLSCCFELLAANPLLLRGFLFCFHCEPCSVSLLRFGFRNLV